VKVKTFADVYEMLTVYVAPAAAVMRAVHVPIASPSR
jgi:hypothetical protein